MPQPRLFENSPVVGNAISLSGSLADADHTNDREYHIDDEVYFVVRATVTAVNHKANNDGDVSRIHSFKVTEAFVSDADAFSTAQEASEAAEAERRGWSQPKLDADPQTGELRAV